MPRIYRSMQKDGEYVKLLRELHSLIADGKGDTEEADRLRDLMDAPWFNMNAKEIRRVRGLSADLHTLVDTPPAFQQCDQELLNESCRLAEEAWINKDWEGALELLRERPHPFPPDRVAFMRAGCWENLGDLETSLLFLERAAELNPGAGYYSLALMYTKLRLGRMSDAIFLADRIIDAEMVHPDLLFKVATVLIGSTHVIAESEGLKLIMMKAVEAIQKAFKIEQQLPENQRVPSTRVAGLVNLAMCYRKLGKADLALQAYDDALELDSRNDAALVGRGVLRFTTDQNSAMEDFKQAVERGTAYVWPHYFYAFFLLRNRRSEECIRVCRGGLQRTDDPSLIAEFYEWIAISQDLLGAAEETVRSAFETARSQDPWNQHIEENYQLFLQHAADKNGSRYGNLEWRFGPEEASRELLGHIK
jgi:tetratricopeptide (TPR) repeat protein